MKIEELVSLLKLANLEILNENEFGNLKPESSNIERNIHFVALGVQYTIEWFINLMTLKVAGNDSLEVKFNRIEHSGTWPNGFKMNLQMYYNKDCVCIIGVENYE